MDIGENICDLTHGEVWRNVVSGGDREAILSIPTGIAIRVHEEGRIGVWDGIATFMQEVLNFPAEKISNRNT